MADISDPLPTPPGTPPAPADPVTAELPIGELKVSESADLLDNDEVVAAPPAPPASRSAAPSR